MVIMMESLIKIQDYGTVTLHLKEVLDQKKIARGTLATAIGSRFEVIDRWYNGNVTELDLDVLARICCALQCQVSDILVYDPDCKKE